MTNENESKLSYIWSKFSTTGYKLFGLGYIIYGASKQDSDYIVFGSLMFSMGLDNQEHYDKATKLENRISELERKNQPDQE